MRGEVLKLKFFLLIFILSSCAGNPTTSQSSSIDSTVESSTTTIKSAQPKVTTKTTQPKKTSSSSNTSQVTTTVVINSFTPKVSNPDDLINNLFYRLETEIENEILKWDEVANPDCENSSLQSCGVTDIFAEAALKKANRNSLLIALIKANMSFIEFYDYFLEEVKNCEEVLDWYISEGGISYKIGNLNLIEACGNSKDGANILYNYLEEIEKFDKNNSFYIQEMYCNATSTNMKNLIHRIIISGDLNSLFYAGITPGASWSYCPTDNEYPPQDS